MSCYPYKYPHAADAMLPLDESQNAAMNTQTTTTTPTINVISLQTRSFTDVMNQIQLGFVQLYNQCAVHEHDSMRHNKTLLMQHINDVVLEQFYQWWQATFQTHLQ